MLGACVTVSGYYFLTVMMSACQSTNIRIFVPVGNWITGVEHMGDQRKAKTLKGFLRLNAISENPDWGQNVPIFNKKCPF